MMFSARVIVILSGYDNAEAYLSRLIPAGIVNIVTADTPSAVTEELLECLSADGMHRYLMTQYESEKEEEETRLEADDSWIKEKPPIVENVKIAVAGAQRRCGTTVTAFNLACWHFGSRCRCGVCGNEYQSAPAFYSTGLRSK